MKYYIFFLIVEKVFFLGYNKINFVGIEYLIINTVLN